MSIEIAVALPSRNEAERIGFVATQVDLGLVKYFEPNKAVIVNLYDLRKLAKFKADGRF